jgi:hypothetical protein
MAVVIPDYQCSTQWLAARMPPTPPMTSTLFGFSALSPGIAGCRIIIP